MSKKKPAPKHHQRPLQMERLESRHLLSAVPIGGANQIDSAFNSQRLAYADLDGDGDLDHIGDIAGDGVYWWENTNGQGAFGAAQQIAAPAIAQNVLGLDAGDIDGDGDFDVIVASKDDSTLHWFRNDGGGTFTQQLITGQSSVGQSVILIDLDQDNDLDVYADGTSVQSYINNGSGAFSVGGGSAVATDFIAKTDFNQDGKDDLIISDVDAGLVRLFVRGISQISISLPGVRDVTFGDVDGDGWNDVIATSIDLDEVVWYENTQTSGNYFSSNPTPITIASFNNAGVIDAGDIDSDGDLDVLVSDIGGAELAWLDSSGGANPTFIERVVDGSPGIISDVSLTDVDADGRPDFSYVGPFALRNWRLNGQYEASLDVVDVSSSFNVTLPGETYAYLAYDINHLGEGNEGPVEFDTFTVFGGFHFIPSDFLNGNTTADSLNPSVIQQLGTTVVYRDDGDGVFDANVDTVIPATVSLIGANRYDITMPNGNSLSRVNAGETGRFFIAFEYADDAGAVDTLGDPNANGFIGAGATSIFLPTVSDPATGQTLQLPPTDNLVPSLVRELADIIPTISADPLGNNTATGPSFTVKSTFRRQGVPVDVTGVDPSDFAIVPVGGSNVTGTVASVSGSGSEYFVTLDSLSGSGLFSVGIIDDDSIVDAAGNPLFNQGTSGANGNFSSTFSLNRVPPTVTSVNTIIPPSSPNSNNAIRVRFLFSEFVSGLDTSDFVIETTGNVSANVLSVNNHSGFSTDVIVSPSGTGEGTIVVRLADDNSILDNDGNPLGGDTIGDGDATSEAFAYDFIAPAVTSISRLSPTSSSTNSESVQLQVIFDEDVTGVDVTDFNLSGITGQVASVTGSGANYTVTIDSLSGTGSLSLSLDDDDSISDAAGNPLGGNGIGNGDFAQSALYFVDRVGPTLVDIVQLDPNPTLLSSVTYQVQFAGIPNNVPNNAGINSSDFQINATGNLVANVGTISSISSTVYDVEVNIVSGDEGTIILELVDDDSIVDLLGNGLANVDGAAIDGGAVGPTYTIDLKAPQVISIDLQSADPVAGGPAVYRVTLDEEVTGVDLSDFLLTATGTATGTLDNVQPISGTVYDVTVISIQGDGTLTLNVVDDDSIADSVGNELGGVGLNNGDFTGETYTVDNNGPVAISNTLEGSPSVVSTSFSSIIDFDTPAQGVDASDFVLTTTGTVSGTVALVEEISSTQYRVTVNGIAGEGTARLDLIDDGSITDALGTPLADTGGTSIDGGLNGQVVAIDLTPPNLVGITRNSPATTAQTTVSFDVLFDSIVNGVDATDFNLLTTGTANGSIQSITGSDDNYTVTVIGISGAGDLQLQLLDDGTITDIAGNPLATGGLSESYTIDQLPPEVLAIVRFDAEAVYGAPLRYIVSFNEAVAGVDTSDFVLVPTGTADAGIGTVTQLAQSLYLVTAENITGSGTLALELIDDDSIVDTVADPAPFPLGGVGTGTGSLLGQAYTLAAPPLPGDYDGNGTVEQADYDVWVSTYGSTTDPRADGNEDGVVDAADYTVWRDNLPVVVLTSTTRESEASEPTSPSIEEEVSTEIQGAKSSVPIAALKKEDASAEKQEAFAFFAKSNPSSLLPEVELKSSLSTQTETKEDLLLLIASDQTALKDDQEEMLDFETSEDLEEKALIFTLDEFVHSN